MHTKTYTPAITELSNENGGCVEDLKRTAESQDKKIEMFQIKVKWVKISNDFIDSIDHGQKEQDLTNSPKRKAQSNNK